MANKSWLNKNDFPFESHYFELPIGRMHYIVEGEGMPIVFVHGNPGWSYEFRKTVLALRKETRCIAADHIGFGLSDKPPHWDYIPRKHAENFAAFIGHFNFDKFILVVNDWGGPIGISYAIDHPDSIYHLVITNSWMWSVKHDMYYRLFSSFAGGPIGRFLIKNFNFFGRVIIKACFADTKNFSRALYAHLENKSDRKGCWTFPKHIIASSDWLDSLWNNRQRLAGIPLTMIWGVKDIAFREKEFNFWINSFPIHTVLKLENAGHYPHEEAPDAFIDQLRKSIT
ncbi:MAG: alpha/beta fold hydrolase [Chitinivibrionales bacterium]|nr:alpha/beta fold hydrolase [Chitinivibrionales bacterium]